MYISLGLVVFFLTILKSFKQSKKTITLAEEYNIDLPLDNNVKLKNDEAINQIQIKNQVDEFEGTRRIFFDNILADNILVADNTYLPMYFEKADGFVNHEHIGLSFEIFQRTIFLNIISNVHEIGVAMGDRMIFLFDNKEKIEIVFQSKRVSGRYNFNSHPLDEKQLKVFLETNLDKWKLISSRRNLYIVGDNSIFLEQCPISRKSISQGIIKYMAATIKSEKIKVDKIIDV